MSNSMAENAEVERMVCGGGASRRAFGMRELAGDAEREPNLPAQIELSGGDQFESRCTLRT